MKIGARVFKSGLAAVVALYISIWLGLDRPVFAALAAVISIQPSIYRSITTFIEQIKANLIGASISVLIGFLLGNSPLVVGLTVIIVIWINLLLQYEKSISIAVFTAIVIMESASGDFLEFALKRFTLIIVGMFSATLINALFVPPKHERKIKSMINKITDQIDHIYDEKNPPRIHEQKEAINQNLQLLNELFSFYQEEVFVRRYRFKKKRDLILYKKTISLFRIEMETFELLRRMKNHLLVQEIKESLSDALKLQNHLFKDPQSLQLLRLNKYELSQYRPNEIKVILNVLDIEAELNRIVRYNLKS